MKSDRTAGPDRTVKSDRTGGPDRTVDVQLRPTERIAVDRLTAKRMSLSKTNLGDEVRKAGGTLSTDRALLLARALKQSPPAGR